MKILFVNPFYKPYLGGIERVIEKLGAEYLKLGYEVAVLTTKYSFPYEYHGNWLGVVREVGVVRDVNIYRLESGPQRAPRFYQAPLVWFSPLEIRKIVNEFMPDIVIFMGDKWFCGNFWVRIFTPKSRHIWSVVWHDLSWKKLWLKAINYVFGKMVDQVVVATNLEKEKVRLAYGIVNSHLKVVPWGVEKTVKLNPKVTKDYLQILCVGRLSHHKGQHWLVNRFIEASPEFKQPVKLWLIGQAEDSTFDEIKELVKGRSDVEAILTASDEELEKFYGESDIFALFPEYESFGLVFLEAQSYGLPVLTHKVGAIGEVLVESAVITEAYDKASATQELVKLVNDREYREEYAKRSQEHFRSSLSWNDVARKFLEI
ncbi:MAG: glycosyltransferase family 4 protein [candidate division WWE3 bacterium]|nr:glycosyltransferase family 4 protein [candidate division WWE3 bacterium]